MSVALIVEDGTGKADANSYCSLASADAYFETRPRASAWIDIADDYKEALLIHSTRILDASMVWDGDKLKGSQALAFPRYDPDTGTTGVPVAIVHALCELAFALNGKDLTADSSMAGIQSLEVGPIKIAADRIRPAPVIPRFVSDLVAAYGMPRASAGFVRLTRR